MASISINADEKAVRVSTTGSKSVYIKISEAANNGLSWDSNYQLVATKGADGNPGTGGSTNKAGNGIDGTSGGGIAIIRCNATVPVKTTVKSGDISTRVNLYETVIKKILGRS